MFNTKREILFTILAGFFVTNAIVGELIGGKLIQLGPFTMSIGIIPWPVVFLTTDIINEYFGKKGVRRLTLMTAVLIIYTFILLLAGMSISASGISPVSDEQFRGVFGQSMWIICGEHHRLPGFTAYRRAGFLADPQPDRQEDDLAQGNRINGCIPAHRHFYRYRHCILAAGKTHLHGIHQHGLYGLYSQADHCRCPDAADLCGHALVRRYLGHEQSERIVKETAGEQ